MELLSSSPKYDVFNGGEDQIIKVPKTDAAREDLIRSVAWSNEIGGLLECINSSLIVPKASVLSDGSANFESIEGVEISESEIGRLIPLVVKGLSDLAILEVAWVGSANTWFDNRINVLEWPEEVAVNDGDIATPRISAGVVHGDFAPKNMIISPEGRLGLIDPEFGTYPSRPEYAMPRMHDAAYFYHLLRCQFQRGDLAESYRKKLSEARILTERPDGLEFWASVMERTLSMHRNFIKDPKAGFVVDDRRKNPEPYYSLLNDCLSHLRPGED